MASEGIVKMGSDVTGVLEAIDNALADGGDAMRWQPPSAYVAVRFTWSDGTETEHGAMFNSVSRTAIDEYSCGDIIYVNGRRLIVTSRNEIDGCISFVLTDSPAPYSL